MVSDLVTCETLAAIVVHARRIGPGRAPIRLSGHTTRPSALCGTFISWDTRMPAVADNVTCRACRNAMARLTPPPSTRTQEE